MFACNPLDIVTEIILESLCAAGISFFTRHRHIAAQHQISPVRDERLMGPAFRVGGEVVSEEPDTAFSSPCRCLIPGIALPAPSCHKEPAKGKKCP